MIENNAKSFYTEEQAKMVLFCSVVAYRKQLKAVKIFNRWWYPRVRAVSFSRKKNSQDTRKLALLESLERMDMDEVDLAFDDYVNLSELNTVWPYSREYLYQNSIRVDNPKIRYVDLFGRYVFRIDDIKQFLGGS